MIKNVIFDIGGVLTDFRWREYLTELNFPKDILERIINASIGSYRWSEFDRGILSDEEVIASFVEADPEIEKELHIAYDCITDVLGRRSFAIPWINALKEKGYKTFYLSNFFTKACDECAHALDFIPHTNGGLMSYEIHSIKPEPEIYLTLMEKYDLTAEECVFIDDTEKNVVAAKALGMAGIVYKTYEETASALAELGVRYEDLCL